MTSRAFLNAQKLAALGVTTDGIASISRTGAPSAAYAAVAQIVNATNNTATPGYGVRYNFTQSGAQSTGFSIGHGVIAGFPGVNGASAQGLASWLVAGSPSVATNVFGVFCEEMNVINSALDSGYSKTRAALSQWTGCLQIVPEAHDLINGGQATFNTLFGICIAKSSSVKNSDSDYAKQYNGLLIEKDSIAPGGRGVLHSGNSSGTGGQNPKYASEIDQVWGAGICTTAATFASGVAGIFANTQKLAWGASESDATAAYVYGSASSAAVFLGVNGFDTLRVSSVGTQVNSWQIYGGATGSGPTFKAIGGDANVNANIQGTGTGGVSLKDGSGATKLSVNTNGVGMFGASPTAQSTGWGTPTGGSVVANFPGATATLLQTSTAVAQIIAFMKSLGPFGA